MRRALVVALALAAGAPGAGAEEPPPERAAFVELVPGRSEVYAGEPFTLRVRLGVDRAWFEAHAVPLHARPMDLPVEVEAAGWPTLAGATRLPDPTVPTDPERIRFVAGGEAVDGRAVADLRRDERVFRIVEAERRFVMEKPGTLELPAPTLRFAHAGRFEVNALGERVPVDRRGAVVRGAAGTIAVRALPDEGRPADFAGATGRFTLAATVDRTEMRVGEPFRLTLVIAGGGNLATLTPPRLDALPGLHLYGVKDDRGVTRRTLVAELGAARGDVTSIPPIALSFFDPESARYETTRTPPIALVVRSDAKVRDIAGGPICYDESRVPPWIYAVTAGVVLGLLLAAYGRLRMRRRNATAPSLTRQTTALAALRTADTDLASAFAELLAARLQVPAAAVIGSDIAARLTNAGVDRATAERAAAVLERLVAARYGGAPADDALRAEALALGERLVATDAS